MTFGIVKWTFTCVANWREMKLYYYDASDS